MFRVRGAGYERDPAQFGSSIHKVSRCKLIWMIILLMVVSLGVWDGYARYCVVRYCEASPLLRQPGVCGLEWRDRSLIERFSFAWLRFTSPKFVAYFELLLLLRHTLSTQKEFGCVWDDAPSDDITEHLQAVLGIRKPDQSKIYPLLYYRWACKNVARMPLFIRRKIARILSQIAGRL